MPITQDFLADNILEVMLGLGEEYDNEFTFKHDGTLAIDNINGISLGGTYYSWAVAGTGPAAGFEGGASKSSLKAKSILTRVRSLKRKNQKAIENAAQGKNIVLRNMPINSQRKIMDKFKDTKKPRSKD